MLSSFLVKFFCSSLLSRASLAVLLWCGLSACLPNTWYIYWGLSNPTSGNSNSSQLCVSSENCWASHTWAGCPSARSSRVSLSRLLFLFLYVASISWVLSPRKSTSLSLLNLNLWSQFGFTLCHYQPLRWLPVILASYYSWSCVVL